MIATHLSETIRQAPCLIGDRVRIMEGTWVGQSGVLVWVNPVVGVARVRLDRPVHRAVGVYDTLIWVYPHYLAAEPNA
jgi:hypothetical protein